MKTRVAAVDGWFTMGDEPALLGSRGAETGSYFFPKNLAFSRNPIAPTEDLTEVELSRRGKVWSWATNHYQPPAPYMSADPFVPYTVVAVDGSDTGLHRFDAPVMAAQPIDALIRPLGPVTDAPHVCRFQGRGRAVSLLRSVCPWPGAPPSHRESIFGVTPKLYSCRGLGNSVSDNRQRSLHGVSRRRSA